MTERTPARRGPRVLGRCKDGRRPPQPSEAHTHNTGCGPQTRQCMPSAKGATSRGGGEGGFRPRIAPQTVSAVCVSQRGVGGRSDDPIHAAILQSDSPTSGHGGFTREGAASRRRPAKPDLRSNAQRGPRRIRRGMPHAVGSVVGFGLDWQTMVCRLTGFILGVDLVFSRLN
jgi:hypothetical protein